MCLTLWSPKRIYILTIQFVPQRKHAVPFIRMHYREIVPVYSNNHMEHLNTLCEQQHGEILVLNLVVYQVTTSLDRLSNEFFTRLKYCNNKSNIYIYMCVCVCVCVCARARAAGNFCGVEFDSVKVLRFSQRCSWGLHSFGIWCRVTG